MIGFLVLVFAIGYVSGDDKATVVRPIAKRGVPWISDGIGEFGLPPGGGWQFGGGSFGGPWATT